MLEPKTKNIVHKFLLNEGKGGFRSLPKAIRFQLLLLVSWPIFLGLALTMRDPMQLLWVSLMIPAILGLYCLVKFGIPKLESFSHGSDRS